MSNREKIIELMGPKLIELGCFLVDLKVNPSTNKYEVFIDSDEGVTIQACEKLSRFLLFTMDNDGSFPSDYMLDVSSPGMDNPFKVKRQYLKNVGKTVEVILNNGIRKEGKLQDVNDERLKLEVHHPPKKKGMKPEVTEETFALSDIKSTRLHFEFGQAKRK